MSNPEDRLDPTGTFLEAIVFAAEKHRDQVRVIDSSMPAINHCLAVARTLARAGVTDLDILRAAVLHDTIEDTDTTAGLLEREFGTEVRDLVLEVTYDASLPDEERKRLQVVHAATASQRAKLIKLADKICNVTDVARTSSPEWPRERKQEYFTWAERVVSHLRGASEVLEGEFDDVLAASRRSLERPRHTPV